MPATQDNDGTNGVRLAVKLKVEKSGVPFLGCVHLQDPLKKIITEMCKHWMLEQPELFALQYSEAPVQYVTEENRSRIRDGVVLHLVHSASKTARDILKKINQSEEERKEGLEKLAQLSDDIAFAIEFINIQGLDLLLQDAIHHDSPLLPPMLSSFLDLMGHGIMKWDDIQLPVVERVASYVTCQETVNAEVLSTSLFILENIILNSPSRLPFVEEQITIQQLLSHIPNAEKRSKTQEAALALINALIQKSEPHMKEWYCSILTNHQYLTMIFDNVVDSHVQNTSKGSSGLAHQLYVLQQLIFNQCEECMNTSVDVNDQDVTDKITELWEIAFKSGGEVKEYKKLGFKNDTNLVEDLKATPLGVLALDNMVYFARKHSDHYARLVLENCYRTDSREYPLGHASIALTKLLLCDILKIGEVPSQQGQSYYAMFFSPQIAFKKTGFQELFSICIVLFNKTWKEMKATIEDFSKVVNVVKEQIEQSLSKQPLTLEVFQDIANNITCEEIAKIWDNRQLINKVQMMKAPSVLELREALEPGILELIQQHHLRFLEEGTKFNIARGVHANHKFLYCRLSPNHKLLHYDEGDDTSVPPLEELTNTISIVKIKEIVTGRKCPHMQEKAWKKNPFTLAFSVLMDGRDDLTTSVDFMAPDKTTYDYWVDGLSALLCKKMQSPQTQEDLEMLLDMEVTLHLLNVQDITIPHTQPEIPPPPPDFDFHYLQE